MENFKGTKKEKKKYIRDLLFQDSLIVDLSLDIIVKDNYRTYSFEIVLRALDEKDIYP